MCEKGARGHQASAPAHEVQRSAVQCITPWLAPPKSTTGFIHLVAGAFVSALIRRAGLTECPPALARVVITTPATFAPGVRGATCPLVTAAVRRSVRFVSPPFSPRGGCGCSSTSVGIQFYTRLACAPSCVLVALFISSCQCRSKRSIVFSRNCQSLECWCGIFFCFSSTHDWLPPSVRSGEDLLLFIFSPCRHRFRGCFMSPKVAGMGLLFWHLTLARHVVSALYFECDAETRKSALSSPSSAEHGAKATVPFSRICLHCPSESY